MTQNENDADDDDPGSLDIRPQVENINEHTPKGMAALEDAIQRDGWIGAITVAADGEAFAGSARLEKGMQIGLRTRVVDIEGDEMLVARRRDIPTATDDRARRLGIGDNRIQEIDYNPNQLLLGKAAQDGLLSLLQYGKAETAELLRLVQAPPVLPPPGDGGDDFDTNPLHAPMRAQRGDIWRVGPHTLMCGDALSETDMRTLMHERVAALMLADPPYNVGFDYEETGGDGNYVDEAMDPQAYEEFCLGWMTLWRQSCLRAIVTPGGQNQSAWCRMFEPYFIAPWIKLNAMTHGKVGLFWTWEPLFFFGLGWPRRRANDTFTHRVTEQHIPGGESLTPLHPCPKPLSMYIDFLESYTDYGDLVVDPMAGTGTTMVAAHRTGRVSLCMDKGPAYCDVMLSRALAEGIGPIERIAGREPTDG